MNGLMLEWIFMKYFPTAGRVGRKEYILGILSDYILLFILLAVFFYSGSLEKNNIQFARPLMAVSGICAFLFFIISYIRSICITIRRLHDLDRSGTQYFLLFFPIYNIYLIILLIASKGTLGRNSYGDDPIIFIA